MAEEVFAGHKYMRLMSFRADGSGVLTPVWFAYAEGKLYFFTTSKTWKVKRIQANPKVEICPCSYKGKAEGPSFEATARILEGNEALKGKSYLQKKYGFMYTLIRFGSWLKRNKQLFVEVVPGSRKEEAMLL